VRKYRPRKKRGRPRKKAPKSFSPVPANLAKFAEFQQGLHDGKTSRELCRRLHIHEDTGSRWAGAIQAQIKDALHARGIGADQIAAKLERLMRARTPKWNRAMDRWDIFDDGRLQLDATREAGTLLQLYPKKDEGLEAELTVVIRDVVQLGPEGNLDAAREIFIGRSKEAEHQGDAGSRPPAGQLPGGRILDAAQGQS
jgi:hypothetical protein